MNQNEYYESFRTQADELSEDTYQDFRPSATWAEFLREEEARLQAAASAAAAGDQQRARELLSGDAECVSYWGSSYPVIDG